jgi:hypothetical protein
MEEERIFCFLKMEEEWGFYSQKRLGEEENVIHTQRNKLGHQKTLGSSKLGDQVCFKCPARHNRCPARHSCVSRAAQSTGQTSQGRHGCYRTPFCAWLVPFESLLSLLSNPSGLEAK